MVAQSTCARSTSRVLTQLASAAAFDDSATDALTAADSQTGALVAAGTVAETVSLAESQAGALTAVAGASDSLTVTDSATGALIAVDAVSDALAATDSQAADSIFVGVIAESLTVAETTNGEIAGPPATHDVTVDETLAVAETTDAAVTGEVTDAGGLSGTYVTYDGPRRYAVEQDERLAVRDRQRATRLTQAQERDALTIAETQTAGVDRFVSAAEAIEAVDAQRSDVVFTGASLEQLAAADGVDAAVEYAAEYAEPLSALDTQWCTVVRAFTPPKPWTPDRSDEEAFLAYLMTT